MSSPKALVQILITGTRILSKAFYEAGRQAVKNARQGRQGSIADDGVGNAVSGSATDRATRQHRMSVDEAQLILNVKQGDTMETIIKHYEHLFKTNSPLPPIQRKTTNGKNAIPVHSHYLQSKVVRARERIEAEQNIAEKASQKAEAPPP